MNRSIKGGCVATIKARSFFRLGSLLRDHDFSVPSLLFANCPYLYQESYFQTQASPSSPKMSPWNLASNHPNLGTNQRMSGQMSPLWESCSGSPSVHQQAVPPLTGTRGVAPRSPTPASPITYSHPLTVPSPLIPSPSGKSTPPPLSLGSPAYHLHQNASSDHAYPNHVDHEEFRRLALLHGAQDGQQHRVTNRHATTQGIGSPVRPSSPGWTPALNQYVLLSSPTSTQGRNTSTPNSPLLGRSPNSPSQSLAHHLDGLGGESSQEASKQVKHLQIRRPQMSLMIAVEPVLPLQMGWLRENLHRAWYDAPREATHNH